MTHSLRGRPPKSKTGAVSINTVFRLTPEVDEDLRFVTFARGHASKTEAISTLITLAARQLRRRAKDNVTRRVMERAAKYPRSKTAGGPRMDRAERILRAAVEDIVGSTILSRTVPNIAFENEDVLLEATDDAIDALGDLSPEAEIAELYDLGLAESLAPGRYILLETLASGDLALRRKDVRRRSSSPRSPAAK